MTLHTDKDLKSKKFKRKKYIAKNIDSKRKFEIKTNKKFGPKKA